MNRRVPFHPRRSALSTAVPVDRSRVLDTLVNNLAGMAYRCVDDERWTMRFVSHGCLELTGFAPAELVDGDGISWEELTFAEDRERVRQEIRAAVAAGQRFSLQYRIVARDGTLKWVIERGIAVADESGEPVIEGFVEDVTRLHETMEAQQQAELRYRHIFEHASEGIFQTSREGRYLAANPALANIYGYPSADELIADLADIEHQLYVKDSRRQEFRRLLEADDEVINFESEVFRRDGSRIWISENAHVVHGPTGEFLCYEGTVQDITERRNYQEQLERQANHDLLTGLPNRNLLGDRLAQAIVRAERLGYFLAVVFVDLDNFKFVNDSLGHAAGDRLLVEIAGRLRHCLRGADTVARLGGDEFVLLLNDHYRISSIIAVLERVLIEIGRPVVLDGREFQVGASLGVAIHPQDGDDAESLLKHADVAMYAAKNRGRNNFQFFIRELNQMADERLNLESALRAALEQEEFDVYFQAKVDHRRRIVGAEALARWHHAGLGMVSPDRFIPIAEDNGLIVPLSDLILRRAFAAAAAWAPAHDRPVRVAVNLSPKLFLADDLVGRVATLLRETGLPPERVELEITESVLLGDSERAVRILSEFKELGVALALDDFGTGYSSLSYLRRLPVDIIKIDRSLVTGIEQDEEVAMIARAVISLGQSLRKTVVAEGVEHAAQFDFLRYQGCNEFQGYLLSRPIPADDFATLLARSGGQL
jgi:diguanylate cyclase (GGDEF)-like protein/PAS domain S-box-containing protein